MKSLIDVFHEAVQDHVERDDGYRSSMPLGPKAQRAWDFLFAFTIGPGGQDPVVGMRIPRKENPVKGVEIFAQGKDVLRVMPTKDDDIFVMEIGDHSTDFFRLEDPAETQRFLTSVIRWAVENTPASLHERLGQDITEAEGYLKQSDKERAEEAAPAVSTGPGPGR